ncbi:MAG: peptidase U32 family protein [Thermodesulfobacteriota bacterium]|nr:peptidase U32 family protein [Thermodesulfobacteriota bacterium]
MKIVIGSPGDIKSTGSILSEIGNNISEIYLSVNIHQFGSGRDDIYDLSVGELKEIRRLASSCGVEISVALNSPCFNGIQFHPPFQEELKNFLIQLKDIGIDKLIITDPYLIRYILNEFPSFEICVSSISYVDTPEKARFYDNIGVSRIILPIDLVRNLPMLKRIRHGVSCSLEVMANLGCMYNCPYHTYHSQYHTHKAKNGLSDMIFKGDYYKNGCNEIFRNEPWRLIGASYIRPEDIPVYDDLGIEYLKLAGRELPISWIINSAKAYINQKYYGNILEILTTTYKLKDEFYLDNKELQGLLEQTLGICNKGCYEDCAFTENYKGASACMAICKQILKSYTKTK